jgi:hypothetical protein
VVTLPKRPASSTRIGERDDVLEARRQVKVYCQSLVDAGVADWRVTAGETELIMDGGEVYVFGELGLTRLR